MKLCFSKGAGKFDRLEIRLDSGEVQQVQCPKQGIIPHDMVHYAVEYSLQTRGFLGRVKAGEPAAVRMQAEPHSDAVERLVEVFQGDGWSGGGSSAADLIDLYRLTCDARACPALPVDEAAIEAVRTTIAGLSARWQAVPVGGLLQLEL